MFTKNDPNKQTRRKNKKYRWKPDDDEEVEVNLYKDLDLNNFENSEEMIVEAEEPSEFVITLQKTDEHLYQILAVGTEKFSQHSSAARSQESESERKRSVKAKLKIGKSSNLGFESSIPDKGVTTLGFGMFS